MIKYFRFSRDYVLWGISYPNLIMQLATIPSYETEEKKEDSISTAKAQIDKMARPSTPDQKSVRNFFSKT